MRFKCIDGTNCTYIKKDNIYKGYIQSMSTSFKYPDGIGYKIERISYTYPTKFFIIMPDKLNPNLKIL
jgi:hypothetical protein